MMLGYKRTMIVASALAALFISAVNVGAQNVTVADSVKLSIVAGEAQSTVVPPGKKSQCEQGRFLVTNDRLRPPDGVVFGQDLNQPGGTLTSSSFDMGALSTNFNTDGSKSKYYFGTNDHDLVSLSNGDVLYITGAFSRMPINLLGGAGPLGQVQTKEPDWFKDTYRKCIQDAQGNCLFDFGPNTRSVVLVFRSTDCGEHFTFLSEMDPLRFGDGTCALPQFRKDGNGNIIPTKDWDMGGTDGQLVKVDPANDHIFMTFQCVGYHAARSRTGEFALDSNHPVDKTLVLMSNTGGATWKSLGYVNQAKWRMGVVPLGDELGFGVDNALLLGNLGPNGKYVFDTEANPASNEPWTWEPDFSANKNVPLDRIYANMWAHPILTRTPDAKSYLLAFPDVIGKSSGFGYRLYWYDRGMQLLTAKDSVMSANPSPDNVIFHLTAVDPGKGPVLFYWYDLDSAAKQGTIRGRLIADGASVSDSFTISLSGGQSRSFGLTKFKTPYWFGDYLTAGGYVQETSQTTGSGPFSVATSKTARYVYFPMWVEPDGTINYARVEYAVTANLLGSPSKMKPLRLVATPARAWKPWLARVDVSKVSRPSRDLDRERDMRPVPANRTGTPRPVRPRPQQ